MKLADKQTATRRWGFLVLGIGIIIVISAILFYTGNYPLKISGIEFLLDIIASIVIMVSVYFILTKMVYKPK